MARKDDQYLMWGAVAVGGYFLWQKSKGAPVAEVPSNLVDQPVGLLPNTPDGLPILSQPTAPVLPQPAPTANSSWTQFGPVIPSNFGPSTTPPAVTPPATTPPIVTPPVGSGTDYDNYAPSTPAPGAPLYPNDPVNVTPPVGSQGGVNTMGATIGWVAYGGPYAAPHANNAIALRGQNVPAGYTVKWWRVTEANPVSRSTVMSTIPVYKRNDPPTVVMSLINSSGQEVGYVGPVTLPRG